MQENHSNCFRVAQHEWFWDFVTMSSQIPLYLPNLLTRSFNQTPHRNLSNLDLHAWLLEPQHSMSRVFLRQWRLLKENQPDQSMRQVDHFKWCLSKQVDFRAPPIKSITGFLMYLFEDRKLQSSTIDGYRSAIADKLGNSPINVNKVRISLVSWTAPIETWNFSLVLHKLVMLHSTA